MLEFSIPDSEGTRLLNNLLIELLKERPDMFYEDFKITSTYGIFSGCTWNGGRDILGIMSQDNCEEVLKYYNDNNISYRYTFTNKFLEKGDLFDRYCNMLLRINKKYAGITYNKSLIKKYVKRKYSGYYFVSSCTKGLMKLSKINKLSKKEIVVLDFKLNNTKLLKELKYPQNIEVIVNEQCMDSCPFRELHYSMMAKKNLFISNEDFDMNPFCKNKQGTYDTFVKKQRQYVSRKLIYDLYLKCGINKFKLVGRNSTKADLALLGYLDYFVKPEFKAYFIQLCRHNNIIN